MNRADLEAWRTRIRHDLLEAMAQGAGVGWSNDHFNSLALEVFRYQASRNHLYAGLLAHRGIDPDTVEDWRKIPPVPARAFAELPMGCSGDKEPQAVFRTSGTARGRGRRGVHPVRDLALYQASLLTTARHFLRPPSVTGSDPRADPSLRVLALAPNPESRPDSSLAFMLGAFMEAWDDGGGGYFADADWTPRMQEFESALAEAGRLGRPVLLAGTAFAFVHWLDWRGDRPSTPLPSGSTVLETGGYKGRSRLLPRGELYAGIAGVLGLEEDRIVNEYGMTELLSQFYEPVLLGEAAELGLREHRSPPWMRSQVLDPVDLSPLEPGRPGLLCHVDLANLDSVLAVLTEDQGIRTEQGIRVLGRMPGAEPRGCSLAMEELMEARGDS